MANHSFCAPPKSATCLALLQGHSARSYSQLVVEPLRYIASPKNVAYATAQPSQLNHTVAHSYPLQSGSYSHFPQRKGGEITVHAHR